MRPPDAPPPPRSKGAGDQVTVGTTTDRNSTAGCAVIDDTTAEVLAQLHGGQRRAAAWLRRVLVRLDGQGWS